MHHNLPLKRRIRTGIGRLYDLKTIPGITILDAIDRGTKDVVKLAERAHKRQGEIHEMLANVKKNILLMRETKINSLKWPKLNEEIDLLFQWNKEIVPKIRDDLPEIMKEVPFSQRNHFSTSSSARNMPKRSTKNFLKKLMHNTKNTSGLGAQKYPMKVFEFLFELFSSVTQETSGKDRSQTGNGNGRTETLLFDNVTPAKKRPKEILCCR